MRIERWSAVPALMVLLAAMMFSCGRSGAGEGSSLQGSSDGSSTGVEASANGSSSDGSSSNSINFSSSNASSDIDSLRPPSPLSLLAADERLEVVSANPITPVKSQGNTSLCWAYAVLGMIESNHIAMGDSVHLSAMYVYRQRLMELSDRYYLAGDESRFTDRGTCAVLLDLINRRGAMAYQSYPDRPVRSVPLMNKLKVMIRGAAARRAGLEEMRSSAKKILDEALDLCPRFVFMNGAEYTAEEFAHSVCAPGEYELLTSFTHHPFGRRVALELPDNWEAHKFLNVPIDTLESRVLSALARGRSVAWEGDVSEEGFSFSRGLAILDDKVADSGKIDSLPSKRQQAFERGLTTDDHCMEIIGLARHKKSGILFFICKNSWGSQNPYGGLMLMSQGYFRLKTILVAL